MSKQEKTSDELISELYLRRKAAAAAEKAHVEAGWCENKGITVACYETHLPGYLPDLCDVCKVKQPLWEDYKHKANLAGGVLRTLLARGKQIIEDSE